jgi:branched-chain amino acid transport system ATP-binding protein
VRLGIVQVPEGRQIFSPLSVDENLRLGGHTRPSKDISRSLETVFDLFPVLRERTASVAGMLSGGEQQMLALARILRTGARLLLLDEITEGLAPVIVERLGEVLVELKRRGMTIVLVEQNFRFAAPLADRHYLIEHGRVVDQFSAAELPDKREYLNAMLGV